MDEEDLEITHRPPGARGRRIKIASSRSDLDTYERSKLNVHAAAYVAKLEARIKELEGDISVLRLQLSAKRAT